MPAQQNQTDHYTGLGIGAGWVDVLKCRFPQDNGTLQAAKRPTCIPNPV
jgi:hypothetical protein